MNYLTAMLRIALEDRTRTRANMRRCRALADHGLPRERSGWEKGIRQVPAPQAGPRVSAVRAGLMTVHARGTLLRGAAAQFRADFRRRAQAVLSHVAYSWLMP